MAARAAELGDVGENAPEHWEKPLGSQESPSRGGRARARYCPPGGRFPLRPRCRTRSSRRCTHLATALALPWLTCATCSVSRMASPIRPSRVVAFPAPIHMRCRSRPASSSWGTRTNSTTSPLYRARSARRNGTYAVFRKLHTRVAAFRQYLNQHAKNRAEEEWLSAKIVGRWPSGAPLALAPDKDDPELGADPKRNNAFMFGDDPRGLKSPIGAHVRRMNPRDSVVIGEVRLHRMIRRGTNYGQRCPPESWRTMAPIAASYSPLLERTSTGSSSSSRGSGQTTVSSSAHPPKRTRWSAVAIVANSLSRIGQSAVT